MYNVNDIFSNTMNEYYRNMYQRLHDGAVETITHPPKFVKEEGSDHYRAEPFKSFYGDCTDCKYYRDSAFNFVEGGNCKVDGSACGYGFTCKNHRFLEEALYQVEYFENQFKKKDGDQL